MLKNVLTLLLLCLLTPSFGQQKDSLIVYIKGDEWTLHHTVKAGETVFSLARRYHVPASVLTQANNVGYQDALPLQKVMQIPLGAYNLQSKKPVNPNESRPLYYHVTGQESLYRISKKLNVSQSMLQEWNNLPDAELKTGSTLLVGWILYDATPVGTAVVTHTPSKDTAKAIAVKPVPAPVRSTVSSSYIKRDTLPVTPRNENPDTLRAVSQLEEQYNEQTNKGANAQTEKGAAVFFNMPGNVTDGTCYAFQNDVAKGTIVKVHNPGNGNTVYVKILGPLPNTKQYHNAIIGIGSCAKAALGSREDKVWCEISY